MFTDEHRRSVFQHISQRGLRAFDRLCTADVLSNAASQNKLRVGRGPLCVVNLAWLAVASALHATRSFADVLCISLKLLQDADSWSRDPLAKQCKRRRHKRRSKHDPRPHDPLHLSEEAFCQARSKMPSGYWIALICLLGEKFRREHGQLLNWNGYRLLALDGTTLKLGSCQKLREHYGTASNRKKRQTPQARMVMLTFPSVRMPFRYELSPLARSEKTCAQSLLRGLSANDLVLMDKGFWSYGIFWQIAMQQAYFAIRLFATAKLKTLKHLGKDDRLASYGPCDRKWKNYPSRMKLRVMRYQVSGFRPTALVTNLLNPRIAASQWVGLASQDQAGVTLDGGVYHRRWEIETTFCEMKVRQQMEKTLRARTPKTLEYEVAGHVLLYLLVRWLIVEAAVKAGVDALRISYLQALRELADMTPSLLTADSHRATHVLMPRLLARVAEHRVPLRPGRHYPRPNDTKIKDKGRGRRRLPSKLVA